MDEKEHYQRLAERYLAGTATQEELDIFFHLLDTGKLDAYLQNIPVASDISMVARPRTRILAMARYMAAASVVLALAAGAFFYLKPQQSPKASVAVSSIPQASPGTKKAMLTLGNGQTIALDQLKTSFRQGDTRVVPGTEALVYKADGPVTEVTFNTITTPNGGEYQVVLPDGSKVWLNAGTSLRYPTAFQGRERRVELYGEAYFEVAKKTAQPFIVHTPTCEVEVLGTHFNVMAYGDESYTKTTLAEGSVALRTASGRVLLQPGEGGTVEHEKGKVQVAETNVDADLAWQRGQFYFNKTELAAIMKQIGRWYDLDIRYAGPVPKQRFVGRISRHTNLSEVLNVLRLSGIQFSMAGRTLLVNE